ncbi:hypothetical protein ACU610_02750 [Geodermatophilus sp. URMC 61]
MTTAIRSVPGSAVTADETDPPNSCGTASGGPSTWDIEVLGSTSSDAR